MKTTISVYSDQLQDYNYQIICEKCFHSDIITIKNDMPKIETKCVLCGQIIVINTANIGDKFAKISKK